MKKNYIVLLLCVFELIPLTLNAQKWLLIGRNKDNPDGFSIVCTEAVTSADVVYITENEYNSSTNNFNTGESIIRYIPPAGGHNEGEVITISESPTSSNVAVLDGCSSGTCGTVLNVGGTFAIGTGNDELYTYTDNDDNPANGVTEIYGVWWWNGSVSSGEDPTVDFPNAVKIEFLGDISSIDFTVSLRSSPVLITDFANPGNYTTNGSNTTLSTVPFTLGILSNPDELVSNSVKFYPSPVTEYIQVSGMTEVNSYEIYNLLGAKLKEGTINNQEKIYIQDLSSSVYIMKLNSGVTHKFLKK